MNSKISMTPKMAISAVIFFAVCLLGTFSQASGTRILNPTSIQGDTAGIKLINVQNDTDICHFQLFYGSDAPIGCVFPHSTFTVDPSQSLFLPNKDLLVVKCLKGSFVPVYVQYGGKASGEAEFGYTGPFYLTMWLQYPQVPDASKVHVRFMVKKGTLGTVGLKIGNEGDYRFVAHENVKFIV